MENMKFDAEERLEVNKAYSTSPEGAEYFNDGYSPSEANMNLVKSPERALSIFDLKADSALSGLNKV